MQFARTGQRAGRPDARARRWAFDTTSTEPTLATRNQLNSSPALGPKGIYLGSQDGAIWYVPYDFCLRPDTDPRCVSSDLPDDGMYVFGVNVGGGGGCVGVVAQAKSRGRRNRIANHLTETRSGTGSSFPCPQIPFACSLPLPLIAIPRRSERYRAYRGR